MLKWQEFSWSWIEFCGTKNFTIWNNNHQDLTPCFQMLCLQIPILSLIAVVSAFYAGKYEDWIIRTLREKFVIKLRLFIVLLLAVTPAIRLIIQVSYYSKYLRGIDYEFTILECFTWFVHVCYIRALKTRLGPSLRGSVLLISLWTMFCVVCIIRTRTICLQYFANQTEEMFVLLIFAIITLILQVAYGLSLIPGEDNFATRSLPGIFNQSEVSIYERFREDFDPYYLGTAMERSNFLSLFFFCWVNPLMNKGIRNQLNSSEDVFDLPEYLTCSKLYEKLKGAMNNTLSRVHSHVSLLKVLHFNFAKEFYGIGVLKFIADIAGFASPLLLRYLLTFIENENIPVVYGYLYGAGILLATLIGSFCSIHFDFFSGNICLKLQGTLISQIYHKILCLNSSIFRKISVGELVNYISVDMERISNSCVNFHAVWSIPLQLGVTLYLLYVEIGLAFLAGLIFSILTIPINKIIATKIGTYSNRMMKAKDKRVEIMSEIIKGMRIIKLHVWEEYFISKVLNIREEEMKFLKYRKYLDAMCVYFWATTPVIISVLTFTFYIYVGGELNAAVVFTCLSLLNMLIVPLNAFPWVLNGLIESWVSLKRVNSFLQYGEIDCLEYYTLTPDDKMSVVIKNGSFTWNDEKLHLCNINISIKKGQLIGIGGPVGSGKSSMLFAILGEIQKTNGLVSVESMENGIGLVSQTPWIQQCSVRDNVLFGRSYDDIRYKNVLEACALMDDIKMWPDGDLEMVGEGGSTLSGGQKARIALARAVYQDVNLYLLDDVLSAVDLPVAHHIYKECIQKLLYGKTRIFVTHAVEFFDSSDWVIIMENGFISQQGTPTDILNVENKENNLVVHDIEIMTSANNFEKENDIYEDMIVEEFQKETSASGIISPRVYIQYWKSVGCFLALFILVLVATMQISRLAVDWWLSLWIASNTEAKEAILNDTEIYFLSQWENRYINFWGKDVHSFLQTYILIGITNSVLVIMRAFFFAYGGLRAALVVHNKLLFSICQARMEFFEISPLGRILNRFSSDISTVDDALPFDINIFLAQFFSVIGTLFITIYGIPWLSLFIAPLLPLYNWLQNRYRLTSRDVKRLLSVTLSPMYSQVNETITGISTIRALKQSDRFIKENEEKVDAYQKCCLSALAAKMWLNVRLQMIGICVVAGVCLISVLQRHFDVAHPSFVGLALSYALTLTSSLGSLVNIFVETERKMVAMERVNEYIEEVTPEVHICKSANSCLPFAWPCQGVVSFVNVFLKYRDDIAHSLKNISFETHPGEKIGIVGRTGAGKSSLFSALLRLTDICSGTIYIDAIDILTVPLKKLRTKITVIPQDPFIFTETVRKNIDPLDEHSDFEIWEVINRCNLTSFIMRIGGINAELETGGRNISVGERQLLCLVRAILQNTKIVCIDEATANMDHETDSHIQNVINNSFKQSTIFIISHRLTSIYQCDRIMVMGHGEILEFDTFDALRRNPESNLFKIINQETDR